MKIRSTHSLAILLALAAAGCGRDRSSADAAAADTAATSGPVSLLLDVPARVRVGDEVPLAATLVNRSGESVTLPGEGPDFVVTRADGSEVWRRSRHAAAPSSPDPIILKPNDMHGSGYAWDQHDDDGRPVLAGTYRVRAVLAAPTGQIASAARTIVVAQ
ncbi:MAG: hypothetical protein JO306_11220 [Gemmatimonadetes bacterium]|nr:hypothetical protein [Gemmatimonadota bacterium]